MPTKPKPKPAAAAPAGAAGIPAEVALAYAARTKHHSSCNWIFEVDYSINSKYPRLFVYSIKDGVLYKYKCAHGGGGANHSPHDGKTRVVSNVAGSHCSCLGEIRTGAKNNGDLVGRSVLLHGLSATNSRMLAREIVLHGGEYVHDNDAGTDTSVSGRSQGCIVVDNDYINFSTGGELIDWLYGGSIGVAHYDGRFSI